MRSVELRAAMVVAALTAMTLLLGLGLAATGCTPTDEEEDADTTGVADVVADVAVDTGPDLPEGTRIYAGNINFLADNIGCNVAFAMTWDGTSFPDVNAYGDDTPANAEVCDIEAEPGTKVPIDQVTIQLTSRDDTTDMLHGILVLEYTVGGTPVSAPLDWKGPIPSPATGFAGNVDGGYKNFTTITWHVGAQ